MNKKLYIMRNSVNLIKVGISRNPTQRREELKNTSGLDIDILSVYEYKDIDVPLLEKAIHNMYTHYRKNGEWFDPVILNDIEETINFLVGSGKFKIKVHYDIPLIVDKDLIYKHDCISNISKLVALYLYDNKHYITSIVTHMNDITYNFNISNEDAESVIEELLTNEILIIVSSNDSKVAYSKRGKYLIRRNSVYYTNIKIDGRCFRKSLKTRSATRAEEIISDLKELVDFSNVSKDTMSAYIDKVIYDRNKNKK